MVCTVLVDVAALLQLEWPLVSRPHQPPECCRPDGEPACSRHWFALRKGRSDCEAVCGRRDLCGSEAGSEAGEGDVVAAR